MGKAVRVAARPRRSKGGTVKLSHVGPGGAVRFNTGLSMSSWSGQDMAAQTAADGAGSTLTINPGTDLGAGRRLLAPQRHYCGEPGSLARTTGSSAN